MNILQLIEAHLTEVLHYDYTIRMSLLYRQDQDQYHSTLLIGHHHLRRILTITAASNILTICEFDAAINRIGLTDPNSLAHLTKFITNYFYGILTT